MSTDVIATDDPGAVLKEADEFLRSDPVRHNVILTLLKARVALPEPGRYWMVRTNDRIVGFALQSPLAFMLTVTPMPTEAAVALVEAIADVPVPGVNGEAATAASVAGHWTECVGGAARPVQGQRLYEVADVVDSHAKGFMRQAKDDERDLMIDWFAAFATELGERPNGAQLVDARQPARLLWIWEDDGPVSLVGVAASVFGVSRIGPVYTPPERRKKGYASALTAGVSKRVLAQGDRCILYTDLGNATSNAIYRAIGYRASMEALRYEFTT